MNHALSLHYNLSMKIGKHNLISSVTSALEIFTAFCGVILTFYIMFASESKVLLQMAIDFARKQPQPLAGLLWLVFICLMCIGVIMIALGMLFPFAVRADSNIGKEGDLKYLYSIAAMGLGPWLDFLIMSLSKGFSMINLDRVAIQYLGIGTIALFLVGISGKALSPRGALIVSFAVMIGFVIFYAGLWMVGGMGNIFDILVWHGVMLYAGFAAFQEWFWFIRGR